VLQIPRLYAIVDISAITAAIGTCDDGTIAQCTRAMVAANVGILQLRAKESAPHDTLAYANAMRRAAGSACTLILNDRPDLALLAGFDGCHVGQDDISPAAARRILGPDKILGVSTHNTEQVRAASATDSDYIAIGPVFATASKSNHSPVIGLDGVRAARDLTTKPFVAIGGITPANAAAVIAAGANSVAIISGLLIHCTRDNLGDQLAQNIRDFLARIL
jgi:thiamine-phosphate pyrophosphorylase